MIIGKLGAQPCVSYCNLLLIRDGFLSSFDDTEFIGNPPEGSIGAKNGKVVYFVVYEIPSLDCLSDRGLEYLQRDLREYDQKIHLEYHRSGLTLQTLYGDKAWVGSRIHVRIACAKTLTAHYSTCTFTHLSTPLLGV